jgi:transcriptional regulator GlxA family with amidase domain
MKFRNHIHSGLHLAQDFIIENINKKRTLSQLAEIANMSERNFTRIFKKETGIIQHILKRSMKSTEKS